jgi:hypothetical protein
VASADAADADIAIHAIHRSSLLAARISINAWPTRRGPVEELDQIPGIGEATMASLRDEVTV